MCWYFGHMVSHHKKLMQTKQSKSNHEKKDLLYFNSCIKKIYAKHFLNDDIKQFSLPEFYTDLHIHLFPLSESWTFCGRLIDRLKKVDKISWIYPALNSFHGQVQLKQHIINKAVIRQPGKIHLYGKLIHHWIHWFKGH